MPPAVKFQKDEIINAAIHVARDKGIDAVTAREVAKTLKVSVGPIFTWFASMDELKAEVFQKAKDLYQAYIQEGLAGPIPFLGVGQQYIRFAKVERAKVLLESTDLSVREIAERLAFNTVNYFIQSFRETALCTPAQYRKKKRKAD